jgi:aspartate dehydrogenase
LNKRIGIIGCGTIGASIAKYIDRELKGKARVTALSDMDTSKARKLASLLSSKLCISAQDSLIRSVDLVIEAASAKSSAGIARQALKSGKDVMVMSTGGLLGCYKEIFSLAERKKRTVYLPSGAICGLDGLKAASAADISSVTLTTSKPPKGLMGAPYILKKGIDLSRIKKDKIIFEGDALKAMEGFPANINVAATLSLCGIGPKKTKVRIVASPSSKRNIHEIEIKGNFGSITTRTENMPSPGNPKTSYMAILSAVATLEGIMGKVKIGT